MMYHELYLLDLQTTISRSLIKEILCVQCALENHNSYGAGKHAYLQKFLAPPPTPLWKTFSVFSVRLNEYMRSSLFFRVTSCAVTVEMSRWVTVRRSSCHKSLATKPSESSEILFFFVGLTFHGGVVGSQKMMVSRIMTLKLEVLVVSCSFKYKGM